MFEPIFAHPDEFRKDVEFLQDRELENPGKIYYFNDILVINELYEGIHLFDNSDPKNPTKMGFLKITGNVDVAIRGNLMYADSYVDLLTVDISDLQNPITLCRDEEVFVVYDWNEGQGYFVGTKETQETIEVDCADPQFGNPSFRDGDLIFVNESSLGNSTPQAVGTKSGTANSGITGVGGSFARFSLIDEYLYVINITDLMSYSLSDPKKPELTATTNVSWEIETLFPYKDHLFIGGNNGMFIYNRNNPAEPRYVSEFRHAQACDPVFVKDDIAYVTLRNGTTCQNFINQLDVIDVSDISSPRLLESFDMEHPHGLAVRQNNLYICEGAHGLKVFENDDLLKIDANRIEHVKEMHAYDIIALSDDHLLVVGDDGLYQYDSSNPSDLKELSFIKTTD